MEKDYEEGCLQCGKAILGKRDIAKFCSDVCRVAHSRMPEGKQYLNGPIIRNRPPQHGELHTIEGDEVQLERGVLRVRRRYEDPAVVKAEKEKKMAEEARKRGVKA